MFTRHLLCLLAPLLLCAHPGQSEPMSAAEFEAYTTGKTLFYGLGGQSYGAEQYLQGRQVIWSFLDGDCKYGTWYAEGTNICFVYEDRPEDPQCWSFERSQQGLIAHFENASPSVSLYEAQDLGDEMVCLGPKVGV